MDCDNIYMKAVYEYIVIHVRRIFVPINPNNYYCCNFRQLVCSALTRCPSEESLFAFLRWWWKGTALLCYPIPCTHIQANTKLKKVTLFQDISRASLKRTSQISCHLGSCYELLSLEPPDLQMKQDAYQISVTYDHKTAMKYSTPTQPQGLHTWMSVVGAATTGKC
jgi:hypothetical protein